MENKTKLEVITPTQTMINEEVEMVVVPGSEGHFGVLPLHAHTLSTLNRGIVTVSVSYTHITLTTKRID